MIPRNTWRREQHHLGEKVSGATGHIESTNRKQREINTDSILASSSSFQSGIPVLQMVYLHSGWFIPLRVNFSGNTQTHLEMCLLSGSKSSQVSNAD